MNEEKITFTPEETAFVVRQFNSTQLCPMAPDAIGICQILQSVASKMQQLTEQEKQNNGEQSTAA